MPQENAHAAAAPFSFLILRSAAPSEASGNFTRDRRSRAKIFSHNRHSERSRGCNAADEVREARLSIPWPSPKVTSPGCLDFARYHRAVPEGTIASPVRGDVVSDSARLRSMLLRQKRAVARLISFRPACSRRALPLSLRKEHRLWQWCVCCE